MTNFIIRLLPKQVVASILIRFLCSYQYQKNQQALTIFTISNYLSMSDNDVDKLLIKYPLRVFTKFNGEGE